jgi:hypothetical protein
MRPTTNAKSPRVDALGLFDKSPAMTDSRAGSTTMGPGGLTAVFGMGTGVALRVCSPGSRFVRPLARRASEGGPR